MNIRFIGILAALILVAIFAVQNSAATSIRFLMYELNLSKALVIIVAVAIGCLIGLMMSVIKTMKKNREVKDATRDYNLAQTKIRELEEDKQRLDAANAKLKEDLRQLESTMTAKVNEALAAVSAPAPAPVGQDAGTQRTSAVTPEGEGEPKGTLKDKWNRFMNT